LKNGIGGNADQGNPEESETQAARTVQENSAEVFS